MARSLPRDLWHVPVAVETQRVTALTRAAGRALRARVQGQTRYMNRSRIQVGELRRHLLRRSSAVYEVLGSEEGLVTVRVKHAGLLEPGTIHRFRVDDVVRMELLQAAGSPAAAA